VASAPPASTGGGAGTPAPPATAQSPAPGSVKTPAAAAVEPAAVAKREAARASGDAAGAVPVEEGLPGDAAIDDGGGMSLEEEAALTPAEAGPDGAGAAAENAGDDGVPVGIVAATVVGVLGLLVLLRRRLIPRRLRRSGDAVT
jgi:hypothetical protein